ncbi:phosphatase PAP2 family protein [soil metagenome]
MVRQAKWIGATFGIAIIVAGAPAWAKDNTPRSEYLSATELPDMTNVIGPPPQAGSPTDTRDRQVYRETRALAGTERFALAKSDAVISAQALLDDFACAIGKKIDAEKAPVVARLLFTSAVEAGRATSTPKDKFKRQRPFVGSDDPICTPGDTRIEGSFAYPSGHAAFGWAQGLVLAEMMPEKSAEIMTRARIYGESRVVCGVHTVSDIEAGRNIAATIVARLHSVPAFQSDYAAAVKELAATPGTTPSPAICKIEAKAVTRPY